MSRCTLVSGPEAVAQRVWEQPLIYSGKCFHLIDFPVYADAQGAID